MNASQQHRGPDGDGITVDGPCGLAHRRLSIIDIAHGQQPMDTADGRYCIAYNGEVYNYLDLRGELEDLGRTFETDSDTEVVLQAFAQWGAEACVPGRVLGHAVGDLHDRLGCAVRKPPVRVQGGAVAGCHRGRRALHGVAAFGYL